MVPEDLLRYRNIERLAVDCGLDAQVTFSPSTTYSGGVETVYSLGLQRLLFLQRVLPCTVGILFTRR